MADAHAWAVDCEKPAVSARAEKEPLFNDIRSSLTANHLLLVLIAVIGVSYCHTLYELHLKWTLFDQFYSHGYLLLAFAFYLGFSLRRTLAVVDFAPVPLMLFPLGGAVFLWTLARIVDVQIVQFLLLPALLVCASVAMLGLSVTKLIAGPVCLIYFAIPLWDYAIPLLQNLTVAVCGNVVDMLGVPAHITGNFIEIPVGVFHVENGCSGVNYLVIMLALTYSYAWLEQLPWRQWLELLALALLAGLAANWVRVGSLVIIGHLTQMQHPLVHNHVTYGWIIFSVVMVLMALVGRLVVGNSVVIHVPFPQTGSHRTSPASIAVVVVLMIGPALSALASVQLASGASLKPVELPSGSIKDGWIMTQPEKKPAWSPDFKNADEVIIRKVVIGFDELTLHIFRYHSQSHDKELIGYRNHLFEEGVWEQVATGNSGPDLHYMDIYNPKNDLRYRVWFWYQVGDAITASGPKAKLLSIYGLLKDRSDASLVTLSRACGRDCDGSKPDLHKLAQLIFILRGAL